MDYKEKYQLWLNNVKDEAVLDELRAMSESEIEEAFSKDLSFGTAGLRGVMSAGTNRMNVYTVYKTSEGLARYMLAHDMKKCAITFDSRLNSRKFAEIAASTLARNGIAVILTKECMPAPFLAFITRELTCDIGINITASHNPSQYNGYKVYDGKGCQLLDDAAREVTEFIDNVDLFERPLPNVNDYLGKRIINSEQFMEDYYVKRVMQEGLDKIEGLTAVYTPLNGAGHRIVPTVLAKCGLDKLFVVSEQSTPDGNFPTCPYPNPEKGEALELALALAKEKNADLVIANDPDCDRLGVASKFGEGYRRLSGNEVGILLTDYVLSYLSAHDKMPDAPVVVKTVVTSPLTDAVASSYGAKVRDVLTGFKYIGDVISQLEQQGKKSSFVFGFEESCGYLKGSYVRDKDGVVAAMLIAQCASYYKKQGLTLAERIDQINSHYGHFVEKTVRYTFEGVAGEHVKNELLQGLRTNPLTHLGESKIVNVCDFLTQKEFNLPPANVLRYRSADGSQLIVRPSGTEPLVKCYVSVCGNAETNEARAAAIKAQMDAIFNPPKKEEATTPKDKGKHKPSKPEKKSNKREKQEKSNNQEKPEKAARPRMFTTLNTVTCAMLCAVAVILATTMHAFMETGLANLFAPMHFPILLVGILCGPVYGLIAGIVTPLVSALTNASFTYTRAVPMMVELAMYGLLTGALRKAFLKNPKTNKFFATLVLVIAMVVGRAIHAVTKTLIVSGEGTFLQIMWTYFAADFTSTWAGIITQLILIPAILFVLLRGGILVKYIPDLPTRISTPQETVSEQ